MAGEPEKRVVQPGEGFRVAAMLAPSDMQSDGDHVGALIALITNPKAAAARKAELEKLEASVKQKTEALQREQAALAGKLAAHETAAADLGRQVGEFKTLSEAVDKDLSAREATLATERREHGEKSAATDAALVRRESDVTRREDAISERVRTLRENEQLVDTMKVDLERRLAHIKAAQA